MDEAGFAPEDVIFDPNVLAVATGIEEHNEFAKAFIDSLPLIKALPRAHERRHLEPLVRLPRQPVVREAMHAAFLSRHPRRARHGDRQRRPADGLRGHRARAPRARGGRDLEPPPAERFVELARRYEGDEAVRREEDLAWRDAPVEERLEHALVHGIVDFIEEDVEEARLRASGRST